MCRAAQGSRNLNENMGTWPWESLHSAKKQPGQRHDGVEILGGSNEQCLWAGMRGK